MEEKGKKRKGNGRSWRREKKKRYRERGKLGEKEESYDNKEGEEEKGKGRLGKQ